MAHTTANKSSKHIGSAISEVEAAVTAFCEGLDAGIARAINLIEHAGNEDLGFPEQLKELHALAHKLAGGAHCMGFPFLGELLSRLETQVSELIRAPEQNPRQQLRQMAYQLKVLVELKHLVRPENSQLLKELQGEPARPTNLSRDKEIREVLSRQRIMYADDDLPIRILMQNVFSQLDVGEFKLFENGERLLSQISRFKPTLIITDWMMSPVSGLDILEYVRSGRGGVDPETPVVFLSQQKEASQVQKAIRAGVDHFLIKPFSVRAVENSIYKIGLRH